jgi:hypothetical protein
MWKHKDKREELVAKCVFSQDHQHHCLFKLNPLIELILIINIQIILDNK